MAVRTSLQRKNEESVTHTYLRAHKTNRQIRAASPIRGIVQLAASCTTRPCRRSRQRCVAPSSGPFLSAHSNTPNAVLSLTNPLLPLSLSLSLFTHTSRKSVPTMMWPRLGSTGASMATLATESTSTSTVRSLPSANARARRMTGRAGSSGTSLITASSLSPRLKRVTRCGKPLRARVVGI